MKNKPKTSGKGKKIADNILSGSPEAPGPVNDPRDHSVDNLPEPTDPRWAELSSLQGAQGGM